MKVAIMGAGLAGLTCAYVLKINGIKPHIYEIQYKVGARFANTEAIVPFLHHPYKNQLKYIKEKYGIDLQPIANINRLVVHGPARSTKLRGELGVITARGNHPLALEIQLERMLNLEIFYDSIKTLEDLRKDYDAVVIATGHDLETRQLGFWHTDVVANLTGGHITGDFDPFTVEVWLDNDYAPGGYCFLLPYGESRASLVLAVPGNNIDLENLWSKFLLKTNLKYPLRDTFQFYHFDIGRATRVKIENLYLVGHAGGFVQPFLGFGQFGALISGAEAALDILNKGDYEKAVRPLQKDYYYSLNLRQGLEMLSNSSLQIVINAARTAPFKYMILNKTIPSLKMLSNLTRAFLPKKQ